MKNYWKARKVFKFPNLRWYVSKRYYGSPYMEPWDFKDTIISIKYKNKGDTTTILKPKYEHNKNFSFSLLGLEFYITFGSPIYLIWSGLGWKDKWYTPRHEWNPFIHLYFFKWQICLGFGAPTNEPKDDDNYWEQLLWYLYYYKQYGEPQPNIEKARDKWGWTDQEGKSTWINIFLR